MRLSKKGHSFDRLLEYLESAFQLEGAWSLKYSIRCIIVVSIDRSIVHRMKNGRDLVTYHESYLVLVPPYSSLRHRLYT